MSLDRRQLALGLLGGGVVLGWSRGTSAAPRGGGAKQPILLNTYVQVTPDDRVIIYTPGAEMGQGVAHAMPKIVAEEMDADWNRVDIRLSHADDAFASPVNKKQRSGNSDGIITYYSALRQMGAGARAMLVSAAATRWGVDAASCVVSAGVIRHAASNRSLRFGDVAEAASKLTPPATLTLKNPKAFTLIGKSFPRKDLPPKVDGTALFGADVRLPGMLYAAVKHCPVIGGKITGYDKAALLKRPGVRSVVELDGAIAVVAASYWQARTALDQTELEIESPPQLLQAEALREQLLAALKQDKLGPTWPTNMRGPPKPVDPAPVMTALAAAPRKFEAVYELPYLAHAPMEPPCCTALVTADECHVWGPLQAADVPRRLAAKITGLPLEKVRVDRTYLGGGFGRKWEDDFLIQAVTIAKATPGVPVKLLWTREEDIRHDAYRPAFATRTQAALDAEGYPTAMHSRIAGQSIFTSKSIPWPEGMADPTSAGGLIADHYKIPLKLIDYVEVKTPIRVGYWRSVTQSQNCFFSETAIDEMAHNAKVDPVAYREKLIGDSSPRMLAVMRKAAEASGWGTPLPKGRGRGIALSAMAFSLCAQVAEVEVDEAKRVRVKRIVCAFDCGLQIEPDSIVAQLEGGIVFGLSAALFGGITLEEGRVMEGNFDTHRIAAMADTPPIEVHLIQTDAPPSGVGEASTPVIMPALGNAIFAATGTRLRRLPVMSSDFQVMDA